jgi:hypothetical protein
MVYSIYWSLEKNKKNEEVVYDTLEIIEYEVKLPHGDELFEQDTNIIAWIVSM